MLKIIPIVFTLRKRSSVNNKASKANNVASATNGMLSILVTVLDAASATGPSFTTPTGVVTSVVERDSAWVNPYEIAADIAAKIDSTPPAMDARVDGCF